jgi:hypothetical protein
MEEIGVRIEGHSNRRNCRSASSAIEISLSYDRPWNQFGKALACSLLWEATHILVFYDHLKHLAEPTQMSDLIAHVLVHEITHILQGIDRHSEAGIIKSKWTLADFRAMASEPLPFTLLDVDV